MRRLPVYLVIDTSESTIGEAHDSIVNGLGEMLKSLRRNPYALETVWLSIITFDANARVVAPLTDICMFTPPELSIHPGTALGAAIDLLSDRLQKEVVRTTATKKGDWRPIVFFLTDGEPTDEWREALARFKAQKPRPANVVALGVGDEVDFTILQELADTVFRLDAESEGELPALFKRLFVWLSASVNAASRGLGEEDNMGPRALPEGIERVDAAPTPARHSDRPRQIFLHRVCSNTRKHYLVRLTFNGEVYQSPRTFKVEPDFFQNGDLEAPAVPVELIDDGSVCPYCENFYVFHCECGVSGCQHDRESAFVCPGCGQRFDSFGSFSGGVRGSLG